MKGLKERRQACGMTQADLAKAIGVSQTMVSILEREDVEAAERLSAKINKALGDEPKTMKLVKKYAVIREESAGKKRSQTQRVLDYMRQHGSISQQEAIEAFSCYRLAAKIFELRRDKYVIKTEKVPFTNNYTSGYYAVYTLVGEGQ